MAKYKLGKNATLTGPTGVSLDNVVDVEIGVSGDELDVTVFGDSETKVQPGLADVTFDITATSHSTSVGATGAITVAGFTALPVVVTGIDSKVSPKGRFEYTISYAVTTE